MKWCDDNDATIESAVVNHIGLDRNALLKLHKAGDTYSVHTNMDEGAQIGVLEAALFTDFLYAIDDKNSGLTEK